MLIVILFEPVPFILHPCRSRRPLIFLCKVKPGGNRQGAATFVVNNHQLADSSMLLEHKCNRHRLSASSLPCSLLSGLYPAHKIKSRRTRRNLRREGRKQTIKIISNGDNLQLQGWVKAIIDNENAEVLCQLEENGVGNIGKKTLVEMAKAQFEHWKEFCQLLDTESRIAMYVCVYGNDILPNGLLCRKEHECVYRDFVKIEPHRKNINL